MTLTVSSVPLYQSQLAYDTVGRLTSKTESVAGAAASYTFTYDSDGQLTEVRKDNVLVESYAYVGNDQVGTPRVVSDAGGTPVKVLAYDSFGVLSQNSNPSFDLPFGFGGGLADPLTGLVRFGFRDYDPAAGRWLARDPLLFDSF